MEERRKDASQTLKCLFNYLKKSDKFGALHQQDAWFILIVACFESVSACITTCSPQSAVKCRSRYVDRSVWVATYPGTCEHHDTGVSPM